LESYKYVKELPDFHYHEKTALKVLLLEVILLTRKESATANSTGKMRVAGFSSASTPRNQTTANNGSSMAAIRKDLRSAS
jgi:hypothetical protein